MSARLLPGIMECFSPWNGDILSSLYKLLGTNRSPLFDINSPEANNQAKPVDFDTENSLVLRSAQLDTFVVIVYMVILLVDYLEIVLLPLSVKA